MANIKISQLSSVSEAKASDTFLTIQDGTNKKITLTTLLKNLNSTDTIRINPNRNAISTVISGLANENLLHVNGVTNNIGIKTATPDSAMDLHLAGHIRYDGVQCTSKEIVNAATVLSVNHTLSFLSVSTTHKTFTLDSGYDGQIKSIVWGEVTDSETSCTVTCSNLVGSPTTKMITFNAVGQSVLLQYVSSIAKWVCVGVNNHNGVTPVQFSA